MRHDGGVSERAMYSQVRGKNKAQYKKSFKDSRKQPKTPQAGSSNIKYKEKKESFPPCPHCGRKNHTENYCWVRPGVQCKICKQFGNFFKICKFKKEQNQPAQVAKKAEDQEEKLFVAESTQNCCAINMSSDSWLIDSGCTNHRTPNCSVFSTSDMSYTSNVRIGNGELVKVEGKGIAAVETNTGTKFIHDVLYVLKITQSLISVGQLLDAGYSVSFHDNLCSIADQLGKGIMSVRMLDRSFALKLSDSKHVYFLLLWTSLNCGIRD